MKELERVINVENVKTHIADVIIKFNFIEQRINQIIQEYIDSEAAYFVEKILLNSLILNVGSKFKILQYIVVTEKVKVSKEWKNSMQMLMTRRNLIAHSDNLLGFYQDLEDVEFLYNKETGDNDIYPIFIEAQPDISIFENGVVNYVEMSRILNQFEKYYDMVDKDLTVIFDLVSIQHASKFPDSSEEARS